MTKNFRTSFGIMCRFLIVKAKTVIEPQELLSKFAEMAKLSRAPNGDWQGDGWGSAWIDNRNKWQTYHSIKPVWEDTNSFDKIPDTKIFLAHARSATFPDQKGILEYNQPYINGEYAFVFNGYLQGVKLPDIPGKIGAEKIWYLVSKALRTNNPPTALENTKKLLLGNSRQVVGLNIGLASVDDIYSLSYFTKFPQYYSLSYFKNKHFQAVCSEKLDW